MIIIYGNATGPPAFGFRAFAMLLSRACLGKMMHFYYVKVRTQREAFVCFSPEIAPSAAVVTPAGLASSAAATRPDSFL